MCILIQTFRNDLNILKEIEKLSNIFKFKWNLKFRIYIEIE